METFIARHLKGLESGRLSLGSVLALGPFSRDVHPFSPFCTPDLSRQSSTSDLYLQPGVSPSAPCPS
jgi:hypothetical protein